MIKESRIEMDVGEEMPSFFLSSLLALASTVAVVLLGERECLIFIGEYGEVRVLIVFLFRGLLASF